MKSYIKVKILKRQFFRGGGGGGGRPNQPILVDGFMFSLSYGIISSTPCIFLKIYHHRGGGETQFTFDFTLSVLRNPKN